MPPLILPPSRPELVVQQRWISVKNISGEDIPAYAAMERVGVDNSGRWHVRKPTRDDHPSAYLNAGARIPKDGNGIGTRDFPTWALYNPDDGDPANAESLGTRAGFWELHRGYEGFLVWGGADGEKVYVQSDLTCRESGRGRYYYEPEYENPCCPGSIPRTICADTVGLRAGDYGLTLEFWNALAADRPSFSTVGSPDSGINPPPWIPDFRALPEWGTRFHDYAPHCWENIFGTTIDSDKESTNPNSPGRKNWLPTWWSQLFEDYSVEEQSIYTYPGGSPPVGFDYVRRTTTQSADYYRFYVYLNADYPRLDTGPGTWNARCRLVMVQIRKRYLEIIEETISHTTGLPVSSTVIYDNNPDGIWEVMGVMRGTKDNGSPPPDDGNCPPIMICNPFAAKFHLTHASGWSWPTHPSSGGLGTGAFSGTIQCGPYILAPGSIFPYPGTYVEQATCTEQNTACTEDQSCTLVWDIVDYDEELNPIYGWVTVCEGLGTYTQTGVRVDLFRCDTGDPFPHPERGGDFDGIFDDGFDGDFDGEEED